jgi:hypothetical protein
MNQYRPSTVPVARAARQSSPPRSTSPSPPRVTSPTKTTSKKTPRMQLHEVSSEECDESSSRRAQRPQRRIRKRSTSLRCLRPIGRRGRGRTRERKHGRPGARSARGERALNFSSSAGTKDSDADTIDQHPSGSFMTSAVHCPLRVEHESIYLASVRDALRTRQALAARDPAQAMPYKQCPTGLLFAGRKVRSTTASSRTYSRAVTHEHNKQACF